MKTNANGKKTRGAGTGRKANGIGNGHRQREFDVQGFLDSAGVSRKIVGFRRKEIIFSQGDPAKDILYIQNGGVKLSVVNETGKEAIVAILGPGDFLARAAL